MVAGDPAFNLCHRWFLLDIRNFLLPRTIVRLYLPGGASVHANVIHDSLAYRTQTTLNGIA